MAFERHLLIDVANVTHAWPELRATMKRGREAARAMLVRRVSAIHDEERVRVTLVVDGRGPEIVVEQPSGQGTLSVVYTSSGLTADDVIEQMVGRAADPGACEVVTGDLAERSTVLALGAQWSSPNDLSARVERAERRLSSRVAALNRANKTEWTERGQ